MIDSLNLPPLSGAHHSAHSEFVQTGSRGQGVSEQFESLFTSLLLKQMRESMSEDGLFGGDQGDVLGGLFDLTLGQHIAAAGGLGIGRFLDNYAKPPNESVEPATTEQPLPHVKGEA